MESLTTNVIIALAASAVFFCVLWLYPRKLISDAQDIGEGRVVHGLLYAIIRRIAPLNRHFLKDKIKLRIERRIKISGGALSVSAEEFLALQEIAGVFFFSLVIFLIYLTGLSFYWSFLGFILGLFIPEIWLTDSIKKRHLNILRDLPYSLDLLTVAVEAGLDFTAAVGKVVEKSKKSPLTDEFALLLNQLKMGKSRQEVIIDMINRVELPSLTTFGNTLIQADKMGTPLGKVLRLQAINMRNERSQRAEKLANEAPVKMLFPLIFFIFPTTMMVLFGPIVFRFVFQGF